MAKLNDLLKRATRPAPDAMGFGAAAAKRQATMLLIALASDHWSRAAADAADAAADVVVLQGRPGERDITDAIAAAGDRPVGVTLNDSSLETVRAAKADFVVVTTHAPAAILVEEDLAVVLQLRDDIPDFQLRALEPWSLDAIFIEREFSPGTIMKVLDLQRVGGLSRKPLLVQVSGETSNDELLALRDAGVAMLAVDMKDRNGIDSLRKLRGTVDALPRRRPRKEDKRQAMLPRGTGGSIEADEDDGDDDDQE
jgi:hypothetical protein